MCVHAPAQSKSSISAYLKTTVAIKNAKYSSSEAIAVFQIYDNVNIKVFQIYGNVNINTVAYYCSISNLRQCKY